MDNKVEALLAISDKANEHFKYLLFYTPQEEKLMFQIHVRYSLCSY